MIQIFGDKKKQTQRNLICFVVWPLISECDDELKIILKVVNKVKWNRILKIAFTMYKFSCWMLILRMPFIHLTQFVRGIFRMDVFYTQSQPSHKQTLVVAYMLQCNFQQFDTNFRSDVVVNFVCSMPYGLLYICIYNINSWWGVWLYSSSNVNI